MEISIMLTLHIWCSHSSRYSSLHILHFLSVSVCIFFYVVTTQKFTISNANKLLRELSVMELFFELELKIMKSNFESRSISGINFSITMQMVLLTLQWIIGILGVKKTESVLQKLWIQHNEKWSFVCSYRIQMNYKFQ